MKKIKGAGSAFSVTLPSGTGGAYSTTYTKIGQVSEIGIPNIEPGTAEVVDLDSTFIDRRPTMVDPGDVSFKVWLDPTDTNHQQLISWASNPPATAPSWQISFPTSPVQLCTFPGYVTGFKPDKVSNKEYLSAEIKINVTGIPVWSTGT